MAILRRHQPINTGTRDGYVSPPRPLSLLPLHSFSFFCGRLQVLFPFPGAASNQRYQTYLFSSRFFRNSELLENPWGNVSQWFIRAFSNKSASAISGKIQGGNPGAKTASASSNAPLRNRSASTSSFRLGFAFWRMAVERRDAGRLVGSEYLVFSIGSSQAFITGNGKTDPVEEEKPKDHLLKNSRYSSVVNPAVRINFRSKPGS